MRWHVEGAFNPSDRGNSKAGDHVVVEEPLRVGRLVRAAGDPLCRPAERFWGLTGPVPDERRVVDCHGCIRHALRLGLDFRALASLDVGRSWRATLVIEHGRPQRIDLQSVWFRQPPLMPPEPPNERRLLEAVQAMVASAELVRIEELKTVGFNELAGVATVGLAPSP